MINKKGKGLYLVPLLSFFISSLRSYNHGRSRKRRRRKRGRRKKNYEVKEYANADNKDELYLVA